MASRCIAAIVVASASACGAVDPPPTDPAIPGDADPTTVYRGHLDQTPPLAFGPPIFCAYVMTLKQLAVEVAITAAGRVASAHVQDLNVEELAMPCGDVGTIAPNVATYELDLATQSTTGIGVTFTAGRTNQPLVTLAANLTRAGAGYTAALSFHRFGQEPPLNWTIQVSLDLAP
jgi:hypothetical protein